MTFEVDEELLRAVREEANDPGLEWAKPPVPLRGGFFAEIFHVWITNSEDFDGHYVIRRLPDDRTWEQEIFAQKEASRLGLLTPRVHLASVPQQGSGKAWMMMDFAEGGILLRGVGPVEFLRSMLGDIWEIPPMLAGVTAQLHALDASELPGKLGQHKLVGANLSWLYSHASRIGSPSLMLRAEQLMASRPRYRDSVFCHGDIHPINVIRGPEGDCLLDWTYAAYDDPYQDIAMTWLVLRHLPIRMPRCFKFVVEAVGSLLAKQFLAKYTKFSGVPLDYPRLDWFKRLATLRILVDIEDWKYRDVLQEKSGHPYFQFAPVVGRIYH